MTISSSFFFLVFKKFNSNYLNSIRYRDYGAKTGSGGMQSEEYEKITRRERLKKLALEHVDLSKDPYIMKNHIGSYECRLCLTLHTTVGNYLVHTQGKRHQTNLKYRIAKESADRNGGDEQQSKINQQLEQKKEKLWKMKQNKIKIGKPGFDVTKSRHPLTKQRCLTFQIYYPDIKAPNASNSSTIRQRKAREYKPKFRFMSAYEQKIDFPQDPAWQYILFHADPYETISFKIPALSIDKSEGMFEENWNPVTKTYVLQIHFQESSQQN